MTTERELLANVLQQLRDVEATDAAPVRRFVAGENLLLVELERGSGNERESASATDAGAASVAGVAHRPPAALPEASVVRDADGFDLARWAVDPPDESGEANGTNGADADPTGARAVGMAALNALSAPHVDWQVGDPMAALGDVGVIGTVGLFRPAFRKFGAVEVRVVEREPIPGDELDAPPGVSVSVFDPTEYETALEGVEVLFVTGSSLIYGGAGRYLAAADVPTVVLIGATASFLPQPAFDAGVTLLAGARVTDPDRVADDIRAGACGTDLHDSGLQKVYVAADGDLPGLDLDVS